MEREIIDKKADPSKGTVKVAVYGSLLSGLGNHRFLDGANYLGTVRLNGFEMYSLGPFPAVVPADTAKDSIVVEVYEVDEVTLGNMDMLEGHPDFYERQKIREVPLVHRAWMYLQTKDAVKDCPKVEGGNWREYQENVA